MVEDDNLRKSTVLNVWGGPGLGKSTLAAGLFYHMKQRGMSVELAREWIKEAIWEKRIHIVENQIYIFAKQLKRITDLIGKVDYIICDSPLPFPVIYSDFRFGNPFHALVMQEFDKMNNVNYYLERQTVFEPAGRMQAGEEEARAIDFKIMAFLVEERIPFTTLNPITCDLENLACSLNNC